MEKVVIVGGNRTPFARSGTNFSGASNQELMTAAVSGLVQRFKLEGKVLGDVALGGVMNHSSDWNLAREVALGCGLSPATPAFGVQRACGTGLEAVSLIANKISLGQISNGIGGGFDSMSEVPIAVSDDLSRLLVKVNKGRTALDKLRPLLGLRPRHLKPKFPAIVEPRTGLTMGEHCEKMAKTWKISRQEQDELALASHKNAAAAWKRGFFADLVSPFRGLDKDNNVRGDTSLEKLSSLKPAFDRSSAGTLTAGNSSALTDGASALFLASEKWAKENQLPILAYWKDSEVAGVDFVSPQGDGLLMAPAVAVGRLLARNNLSLQDFDLYEIHEAFAAQVLCTLKAWESPEYCRRNLQRSSPLGSIDRSKLNVAGGSVALGHPFGATGGRLVATLAKLLSEKKGPARGLISVCTGGGMGVVAILEKA
jgi:acetyl-CoA C-acetyltransferase